METANRQAIKAQRDAEAVRLQLKGLGQTVTELRAGEAESATALQMADRTEAELRRALANS